MNRLVQGVVEEMMDRITQLKALVAARDGAGAYAAGAALLAQAPGHEYASYATAWAAARLGKREECLAFIAPALAAKPDSFNYLSLHAHACLGLGRYAEALPGFQRMAAQRPDAPAAWKALLAIRAQGEPALALPRNVIVLADEMVQAYRGRQWPRCRLLLAELEGVEPLTARYWQLMVDEYLGVLAQPLAAWRAFHAHASARLAETGEPVSPLVDRNIAFNAFANCFSWLVKGADGAGALAELPTFQALYRRPCPPRQAAALAALLLAERRHAECIATLDLVEAELPHAAARRALRLQAHASRWACRAALLAAARATPHAGELADNLADALVDDMLAVAAPGSPQRLVLDDYRLCWQAVRASPQPQPGGASGAGAGPAALQARIKQALAGKAAFALLRLGHDDAYAMRDVVPQLYASAAPLDLDRGVEAAWGGPLAPAQRRRLAEGFLAALDGADVVGLPGPLRMARDLRGEAIVRGPLISALELRYRVLFAGVRALLDGGRVGRRRDWVDARCNEVLAEPAYLADLLETAAAVVLVGNVEIPRGHLFDHPKVTLLAPAAPPDAGAPAALVRLAGPGVLVLAGAGFAGKAWLGLARAAGAVALDLGAPLAALLAGRPRPPAPGVLPVVALARPFAPGPCAAGPGRLGPVFSVAMEPLNQSGRGPLHIQRRARLATSTSVKLLDRNTFVSFSLVGQRGYVVRFDEVAGTSEVLGSIDTTYGGKLVETDSCDADEHGNVITSNFYMGNATLYRCEGGRIAHVRDLPLDLPGYVHGIRFYGTGMFAVTIVAGMTGVHFFDLETCAPLLYVPAELKTQNVHFISDGRMVVMLGRGTPKNQLDDMYDSEVHLIDFCLQERTFEVVARMRYANAHLDGCVARGGRLYINDQFNDRVLVLDADTLEQVGDIDGYDMPHGLDINYGTLAVTNYGANDVRIRRFLDSRQAPGLSSNDTALLH
jgi:hypothetical protein